MTNITRISISVEESLLKRFDVLCEKQGYPTRSEAIKQLMRSSLIRDEWTKGETIAGVITIIYDHHKSTILQKIVEAQHDFGEMVVCSQHAHLDHDNCMENIIVRGEVEKIESLHRKLAAIKGMKHTVLSMSTTGKNV